MKIETHEKSFLKVYCHNNPIKAGLVYKAEEYVLSSAADYVFGRQVGKIKVALLNPVQTTYG